MLEYFLRVAMAVLLLSGAAATEHHEIHPLLRLGVEPQKEQQLQRRTPPVVKTCVEDCIHQTKNGVLKNKWCFNEGAPIHTNYNGGSVTENFFSTISFFEMFNGLGCDFDDLLPGPAGSFASGVHDAELKMTFSCCGTGSTTWKVGCGYTATWFRFNCLGLFIKFEPQDSSNESGSVEMSISGRFWPTNWKEGGPNAWITSSSGTSLTSGGGLSGTEQCDTTPHPYSLSWDYRLNKDTGTIREVTTGTVTIQNSAYNTAGETFTNCSPASQCGGALDPVKGPFPGAPDYSNGGNSAIWTVQTTDIIDGINVDKPSYETECV